jgi:uncharacterized SAM-binding protein YcdF (DUF218 family)
MFFILSKTLVFLVMPLTIVIGLLLVSVFSKSNKWKKRTFYISFCMLLFFSNEFIANAVMYSWEVEARPYASLRKYKVGIVLTGATIYGLKPADRVYFHRGADRLIHTVQLYKLGVIQKILISGGIGKLVSSGEEPEAIKFKKVMLLTGVPEQDIIVEPETRNTAESAIQVKKLLEKLGFQENDCLLITSAFHMRRSILAYKKNGLNLDSFSTDFYAHKIEFALDDLFLPQVDAMVKWNKIVKEWVGVAAYKLTGYI